MKCISSLAFFFLAISIHAQDNQTLDSLHQLLKQSNQNKDWKNSIELNYKLGKANNAYKDFAAAQKNFLKVDSIAKSHSYNDKNTILALVDRAKLSKNTFTHDGTETANLLAEIALTDAKKLNDQVLIHTIYKSLADIKGLKGDLADAKKYTDLAFDYYLKQNDTESISWLYGVYGNYFNAVDSLKKSEIVRKERVTYFRKQTDSVELAKSLSSLGNFYRTKLNQCENAMPYLQEAKVIYEKIQLTKVRSFLYLIESLAICHANQNEYQLAYEAYKQAYNLRKDIVRESNDVTTRQLEAKYQTKEKEQQITILASQNELVEKEKSNQRNLFLAGLALLGILVVFFFLQFRERKKTALKLKELDKAKSDFYANISHEFRTPIMLISGPLQSLVENEKLNSEEIHHIEVAQSNSERLLELVDQLLDLSKLESNFLKLNVSQQPLMPFMAILADSFTYKAKTQNITYVVDVEATEAQYWFDKDALNKIVVNLLSNAFKYTPENENISLSASITDELLKIKVTNTGSGLSSHDVKKVFDRFYQKSQKAEGVGLGLALVKQLVELHKGNIGIQSETDTFTEFNITLPVNKNAFITEELKQHAEKSKVEPIALENKTSTEDDQIMLIVEDNDEVRHYIKSIFEKQYSIIEASNGEEGVSLAIESVPDIIISDVMMPKKDGMALCNDLKNDERTSHIPIILLTAKVGEENELQGATVGADDYITKPFNNKLLQQKVNNLLENRKQLRKRYTQDVILKPTDIAITSMDELFLLRVQSVMDDYLVEPNFSIEDFSKEMGMSRMQLHRKLKAIIGLSTSEFIKSQRLKLATEILKKSTDNISQIGYSIGFNDAAYFSRSFKKAYGCTPTQYAKKHFK